MPSRRRKDPLVAFSWVDPARLLRATDSQRGKVIYEAPDLARWRAPVGVGPERTCWSCGRELDERGVVRKGPGYQTCSDCGAKLPFAE